MLPYTCTCTYSCRVWNETDSIPGYLLDVLTTASSMHNNTRFASKLNFSQTKSFVQFRFKTSFNFSGSKIWEIVPLLSNVYQV